MDSAHIITPYIPFLVKKFEKFFPDPITKGVPLLGDFREF